MKYALFDAAGMLETCLIGGLHAVPARAVELSEDLFFRITQETDGQWVIDGQGLITKQPFPVIAPDLAEQERRWRDNELASVIWLRDRHRDQLDLGIGSTLTPALFTELLTFMQALRDWPQSEPFPVVEYRPVAPSWIAEQSQ